MKTNLQLKPTVFAIFGGSGDLTWRKLVPSLFDLFQDSSMPADFSIIALDRIKLNDIELHKRFREGIEKFSRRGKVTDKVWSKFAKHIYYKQGDFIKPKIYTILKEQCSKLEKEWNTCLLYTSDAADEEDSVDIGGRGIIKKKKKKK